MAGVDAVVMWILNSKIDPFVELEESIKSSKLPPDLVRKLAEMLPLLRKFYREHMEKQPCIEELATFLAFRDLYETPEGRVLLDLLREHRPQKSPLPISTIEKATPDEALPTNKLPDEPPKPESGSSSKSKKKKRRGVKKCGKRNVSRKGREKGTGNRRKSSFKNAENKTVLMPQGMQSGCACPSCHAAKLVNGGTKEVLRFESRAVLFPVIYLVQKMRCGGCRATFEAELPHDHKASVAVCKATPDAMAASLVLAYGKGFPWLRLEEMQAWQGAPFSDSNLWKIASTVFDGIAPVCARFIKLAANAVRCR